MKYLILKFDNASLFTTNKWSKDFVFKKRKDKHKKRSDIGFKNFKEPLTIYQISNIIHVLFGERPVPTFRDVFYKPIDYYYDKALNSYLKINNYQIYNDKKGKYEFVKEFIHTNKSVWNSFSNTPEINWYKIKKYLTNNSDSKLYDFFVLETNQIFGFDVQTIPFVQLKDMFLSLNISKYQHIINNLKGKTPMIDFLTKKDYNGVGINMAYSYDINRNSNNGIDNISKLHGIIYIPINDGDLKRLSLISSGVCTILDGGIVYIDGIKEDYEIYEDNLIKVCDISTDKNE